MTRDAEPMTGHGMHRSMLVCCGLMISVFGALTISSLTTAIGFSTGQRYLTIGGFIALIGTALFVFYRK